MNKEMLEQHGYTCNNVPAWKYNIDGIEAARKAMKKLEKEKNKPIKNKQRDENKKINFDPKNYEEVEKAWNKKKKYDKRDKDIIDLPHEYLNEVWDIHLHQNKFKFQNGYF
jgi:hypothetical protein